MCHIFITIPVLYTDFYYLCSISCFCYCFQVHISMNLFVCTELRRKQNGAVAFKFEPILAVVIKYQPPKSGLLLKKIAKCCSNQECRSICVDTVLRFRHICSNSILCSKSLKNFLFEEVDDVEFFNDGLWVHKHILVLLQEVCRTLNPLIFADFNKTNGLV